MLAFRLFFTLLLLTVTVGGQTPLRLAIVDLDGDEPGTVTAALRSLGAEFCLLDEEQTRAAMRGSGYAGSLNLSRQEARALGMSLGCDFYILGKVQLLRRIASAEEFYYEAYAGLFIVETRTGGLISFAFERTQAATESQARAQLVELIKQQWPRSVAAINAAREESRAKAEVTARAPDKVIEVLTEGAETEGLRLPIFYQRLKPAYPEEASLAGITATVELEVVFRDDGQVGEVEVVRWAGYGLDQSAIATVRQLRFKPAERDGRPVTVRALVRYNFRRPLPEAERKEEAERLRRSLRRLP